MCTSSLGREVDLGHLVDDVTKQIARDHPVVGLPEDGGEHVPRVAVRVADEVSQVRQQVVVHERDELLTGTTVDRVGRPVTPAVRLLDRRAVVRLDDLSLLLHAVEGLEEQQPRQLRDSVEVAIETGVLAHDPCGPWSMTDDSRACGVTGAADFLRGGTREPQ